MCFFFFGIRTEETSFLILVEGCMIFEIKAVQRLILIRESQLANYLTEAQKDHSLYSILLLIIKIDLFVLLSKY